MILPSLLSIFASGSTSVEGACDKSGGFFGLVPWYHYLPSTDFGPITGNNISGVADKTAYGACDLNSNFTIFPTGSGPSDIALILLALVDDLLRVAGLVAIAFVIYGAIRYITSQGNPEGTSKAQSTILNALIGLAISVISVAAVSFIGNQLGS